MTGAAFGYAAGWNPYASDYTRYLKPDTKSAAGRALRRRSASSSRACCSRSPGAAAVTTLTAKQAGDASIGPALFTDLLPTWLGKLTLLAIFLGAVCANVLNIYSGSLSFMALGIRLPTRRGPRGRRARVRADRVRRRAAHYLNDPSKYENFLLIIAYWIGPWLGVVFLDRWFRRGVAQTSVAIAQDRKLPELGRPDRDGGRRRDLDLAVREPDPKYIGPIPTHHPAFGDMTFEVGFVLSAAALLRAVQASLKPTALDASCA